MLPSEDSKSFLDFAGWKYTVSADKSEYIVQRCPFCGDERGKFFLSAENPVWICHHCSNSGNLYQLMSKAGYNVVTPTSKQKEYVLPTGIDEAYERMKTDEGVKRYLLDRGLKGKTAVHFRLGVSKDRLVIPHYRDGIAVSAKLRLLVADGKRPKYSRPKGTESILFNCDVLRNDPEFVVVTEGEMDAISIAQEMGYEYPVVSGTTGAGGFAAEWIDQLSKVRKIYLCYDSDEAGQKGALDLARRLGFERTYNIVLPVKDANELLRSEPGKFREVYEKCFNDASRFAIDGIVSASEILDIAFTFSRKAERYTPWRDVNARVDIRPGHMVCLSADPKIGKTSLALEWARHRVAHRDPVLFYCLEMAPAAIVQKIVQLEFDVSRDEMQSQPEIRARSRTYFDQICPDLWYLSNQRFFKQEDYFELIRAAVRRYGIKFLVFDHFGKLIDNLSNTVQAQANLAMSFKSLAEELQIVLVVIVQPRKGNKSDSVRLSEDMLGSGQIRAEADTIITLSRDRFLDPGSEHIFVPETFVRIEGRYEGGGTCALMFEGRTQKFYSLTEEKEERYEIDRTASEAYESIEDDPFI